MTRSNTPLFDLVFLYSGQNIAYLPAQFSLLHIDLITIISTTIVIEEINRSS